MCMNNMYKEIKTFLRFKTYFSTWSNIIVGTGVPLGEYCSTNRMVLEYSPNGTEKKEER